MNCVDPTGLQQWTLPPATPKEKWEDWITWEPSPLPIGWQGPPLPLTPVPVPTNPPPTKGNDPWFEIKPKPGDKEKVGVVIGIGGEVDFTIEFPVKPPPTSGVGLPRIKRPTFGGGHFNIGDVRFEVVPADPTRDIPYNFWLGDKPYRIIIGVPF